MKKTISSEHGKIIAQHLVKIRQKAGLTQRDLAKKLGREHSFVAHYELGQRRVDLAEFYWICTACEVSPQEEVSNLFKKLDEIKN
jgi:transcriptional regulator with XRE-family HTH domain